jgi:hypothetical protein
MPKILASNRDISPHRLEPLFISREVALRKQKPRPLSSRGRVKMAVQGEEVPDGLSIDLELRTAPDHHV